MAVPTTTRQIKDWSTTASAAVGGFWLEMQLQSGSPQAYKKIDPMLMYVGQELQAGSFKGAYKTSGGVAGVTGNANSVITCAEGLVTSIGDLASTDLTDTTSIPLKGEVNTFTNNNFFNGGAGGFGIGTGSPLASTGALVDIGGSVQISPAIYPILSVTTELDLISALQLQNKSTDVNADARFVVSANDSSYIAFAQPGSNNVGSFFGLTKGNSSFFFSNTRDLGIGCLAAKNIVFGVSNAEVARLNSGGALELRHHLVLDEIAAPGTPATGQSALYTKTDGKLYFKNDAGTETALT